MSYWHGIVNQFLAAAAKAHGAQPHGDLAAELLALRQALNAVEHIVRVLNEDFIPKSFTESERAEVERVELALEYYYQLQREA